MSRQRLAKWIGRFLIGLLWVITAYLLVHYALLWHFGPDRLYALFGEQAYNALFPMGGFGLLVLLALLAIVWGGPVVVFGLLVAGGLWLVVPRWSVGSRLRAGAVAGVIITATLPWVLLDGWPGPLRALAFEEDTEYAPTYSSFGFWGIRPGMTADQVLASTGEPLERDEITDHPDEEEWRWTRSPGSHSYRVRTVRFRHGKVVGKYSAFYVD